MQKLIKVLLNKGCRLHCAFNIPRKTYSRLWWSYSFFLILCPPPSTPKEEKILRNFFVKKLGFWRNLCHQYCDIPEKEPQHPKFSLQIPFVVRILYMELPMWQMLGLSLSLTELCAKRKSGDGGFFHACKDFFRKFNELFLTCAFKKKKKEVLLHALIAHFSQDQWLNSESWDECDWAFPNELCVSSLPW